MVNLAEPRTPQNQLVTNNPVLTPWANQANVTGTSPLQDEPTEWDNWRRLFEPLPEPDLPSIPGQVQDDPNAPYYSLRYNLTGQGIQQEREQRDIERQTARDVRGLLGEKDRIQREEKDSLRDRLRKAARQYFGREPTPAEMQKLWFQAVDEAEAASLIGIDWTPWDALQAMAESEDRPGATEGPRTSTSTQTTINLTDPETAKGIIQVSLRDALGRRATDEEVAQFTAALNTAEEANPTVTTTTSTTTPEGQTTSESETMGGAPSPQAVAQSWLDEELNAEIDIMRAGTEYFEAAQALASGVA